MKLSDFDYTLHDSLIARFPLENRSSSRLLQVRNGTTTELIDTQFATLPHLLSKNDLIIFNDTKVIKARLFGKKISGGKVEVLVEKIINEQNKSSLIQFLTETAHNELIKQVQTQRFLALCHIKANKTPKTGTSLLLADNNISAQVIGRKDNLFIVGFENAILPLLEHFGELPIPPYFERQADDNDDTRYQTVFHNPEKSASVAAPTASLHFDDTVLVQLKEKGINHAFVTLHVGAGTFMPVRTDDLTEHTMHSEYAELPQTTADLINTTKAKGGKVIAVGTTVTRVLESVASFTNSTQLSAWSGETDIFIYPGYEFKIIDRLITNFHLPKSTLLMLVSAFAGTDTIKQAYQHAINEKYRFFSYGDAMLLEPKPHSEKK